MLILIYFYTYGTVCLNKKMKQDSKLIGNKLIEDAIIDMYKNMTDEKLYKVILVIKERIKDGGHFVVAVKPGMQEHMELRPVSTPDGKKWFAAFTSFDEELKKTDNIVSGFTAEISKLLEASLAAKEIEGVIINPWDKALKLNRMLINLLME